MTNSFVIIVPARADSSRLPNKPMAMINGRTVISRVIDLANTSNASNTYIATDSDEIKDHCESYGANVVITSSDHISGMDRIGDQNFYTLSLGYKNINNNKNNIRGIILVYFFFIFI